MYRVLKDIIYKRAHINTFHFSRTNSKNCFVLKETGIEAKCQEK